MYFVEKILFISRCHSFQASLNFLTDIQRCSPFHPVRYKLLTLIRIMSPQKYTKEIIVMPSPSIMHIQNADAKIKVVLRHSKESVLITIVPRFLICGPLPN